MVWIETVAALEARLTIEERDKSGGRGVVVVEPEPEEKLPDVTGTYHLDAKASIKAIFERQVTGEEDEEEIARLRKEIADEFANVSLVLILGKDGTFGVEMTDPEGETNTARGTWTRESVYAEGPQHQFVFQLVRVVDHVRHQ